MRAHGLSMMGAEILRLLRFAAVGVAATATHALALVGGVELADLSPGAANVLAWMCAVPVSYLGHYFFTFRSHHPHGETLWRFFIVYLVALGTSQALVEGLGALGQSYAWAIPAMVVAIPLATFVVMRLLVFCRPHDG